MTSRWGKGAQLLLMSTEASECQSCVKSHLYGAQTPAATYQQYPEPANICLVGLTCLQLNVLASPQHGSADLRALRVQQRGNMVGMLVSDDLHKHTQNHGIVRSLFCWVAPASMAGTVPKG
jgi:hypothetical protein